MKLKVGQIWRKLGPYGWVRIEMLLYPGYPEYDGGLQGIVVREYPPQLNGIKLRGGKIGFYTDNKLKTVEEQIIMNRFLLDEEELNKGVSKTNDLEWNKNTG